MTKLPNNTEVYIYSKLGNFSYDVQKFLLNQGLCALVVTIQHSSNATQHIRLGLYNENYSFANKVEFYEEIPTVYRDEVEAFIKKHK
jgi:hypothetical protein